MATEREIAILEAKNERLDKSLDQLVEEYLQVEGEIKGLTTAAEPKTFLLAGLKDMIRGRIEAANLQAAVSGGFKWEPRTEPKASVSSVAKLKAHFIAEALRPYLREVFVALSDETFAVEVEKLKEHLVSNPALSFLQIASARVQAVVDEEAEANELDIEIKEEIVDGKRVEKQVIKSSRLPNVSVYLHETLGKVKHTANKGKARGLKKEAV